MTVLQNAAMCKTLGAVKGSSGDKMNGIAMVERVEVFANAAIERFLTLPLYDPLRAGVGQVCDKLEVAGGLS